LNLAVTGSWLPAATPDGLWFYTAAVSLILGDLIVHPYFVGPKDSLALSITAAIAVWVVLQQQGVQATPLTTAVLWLCLAGATVAVGAMIFGRIEHPRLKAFGEVAKEISTTLSHPKAVLTAVFAVALAEFHVDDSRETALVVLTWAVLIGVQPERPLYWVWQRLRPGPSKASDFGGIAAYRTPGLLLVRHESESRAELGTFLVCRDSSGPVRLVIALDHTGRDEVLLLRCLELDVPNDQERWRRDSARALGPDRVGKIDGASVPDVVKATVPILTRLGRFLGIVDERTDIQTLYFEVIEPRDVAEGHLVQVTIRGEPVVYQVTNGVTREEVIHRRHTHGYARAEATKVGTWNPGQKRFERATWLPRLNSPVTQVDPVGKAADVATVGHFPGSAYPVQISDVHELVTHNTAILGILGIGKSMLAIELVERMLAEDIKVVCLDLTDQYAAELDAWLTRELDEASASKIAAAGEEDRDKFADNPEHGGSFPRMKDALAAELTEFVDSDDRRLMILNPARFGATRQDSEPRSYQEKGAWQRAAPLWSVTPVQVTQVVAETLLGLVQDEMRDRARVCLVLEEAHSLVPEWNTVANDADRNATNGTARAILQGRKYGFGCLLVTQRTANVTKTILNQCNTVFAMRTFDDTGKAFLSNYLGATYADVLPTLGEREAVFFGKASSCENPIRVRLNDREDFLGRFRAVHPPTKPDLPQVVVEAAEAVAGVDSVDLDPPGAAGR
jgi:hypothetical protein